jgi:hypothetical protein
MPEAAKAPPQRYTQQVNEQETHLEALRKRAGNWERDATVRKPR